MSPVLPPAPTISRPHPKWGIALAYAICPVLLVISCYGFWQWLNIPAATHLMGMEEIFYLICLVVIPLVLFLFLSVTSAQKIEHNRTTASYQMRLDQLQSRLNAQEDFVHFVTDRHPESITIFDKENRYWFVNHTAARNLGFETADILKKPLEKIIGYERGHKLDKRLTEVRLSSRSLETLDQIKDKEGVLRFIQSHYEAIAPFREFTGGVLVREEDVTNLIVERERRSSMLRQVISTLVAVVDRRDPYAAGHSERVGQLSRILAAELLLPEKEIDAAEISGSLMNFGKVLVPRQILTKATALTPEELQRVRDSILTSADILSLIDFDGPVVATLHQVMERYDGTGAPQGLKGETILLTARILAVANAFVALVSARAHRPNLDQTAAVGILMRDADKAYDRRVVTALGHVIENRRDKLDWLSASKPQ